LPAGEVLDYLGSSPEGLIAAEVDDRRRRFGPNRLERLERTAPIEILLRQFASVVTLGDALESAAIAVVLTINTVMGFVIELRATRVMDALLAYEAPSARVIREGRLSEVDAADLVPGDMIQVEEGDAIPADARLVECIGLRVDEASLTGESVPVDKQHDVVVPERTVLAERLDMVYAGTSVSQGRGTAVVVHTAGNTELGRIGALLTQVDASKTPLEARLDALGRRLIGVTLAIAAVVTGLGVARGAELGLMVETGIALAIAAVPEGLPAVATVALAVGLRRMAARRALVRRLAAVESLGATTVICTDKTGTLTAGEMTVSAVVTLGREVTVTGDGYGVHGGFVEASREFSPEHDPWLANLLMASALTTRASIPADGGPPIGDATDAALLVLALKGGMDLDRLAVEAPLEEEVPFTSAHRASASTHLVKGRRVAFLKGAPRALLDRCGAWSDSDGEHPLDASAREDFSDLNRRLALQGLRVIALATGPAPDSTDLTLLGFAGIVDPPAEGVQETVRALHGAGVRLIMLTGDQLATAEAIASRLGLCQHGSAALDGEKVGALSDDELADAMSSTCVIGRASPRDKLRIVTALQSRGEVVAMIGDGVNDAVALKKADVGVAMGGRGTDVARQTAAMVLTDDRLITIGAAVEEGRVIFDNIRKFVFYLFSCNAAEVLVLLGASLVGAPLPLTPLQILWLNIVTDTFPALALALEKAEPGIMSRAPRAPDTAILSRGFLRAIGFYALLITGVTLGAYAWALATGDLDRAVTIAFLTLALSQLFHLGNARGHGPVLGLKRIVSNRWALASVPLVIALQLLALYWGPLAGVLETVPLEWKDWPVVLALAAIPAGIGQAGKALRRPHADHGDNDG
jgi:Ca2+-transporting ATPase